MATVLTNPKTFMWQGKMSTVVRQTLEQSREVPDRFVGNIVKKHIAGLSDAEAGKRIKAFFAAPPDEAVGAFVKSCVSKRLERAD